MKKHVVIMIPVFNDWDSLKILIPKLESLLGNQPGIHFSLLIINDSSTDAVILPASTFFSINLLHLLRNIGHQKAIAIGLAYVHQHIPCEKVLVMDSDGEDRPEDAIAQLQAADSFPDMIIMAQRKKRKEKFFFQFFYSLYKLLFRILTGRKIAYGNFFVIPRILLDKLVYYSEIWNNIPGGILKSQLPYKPVQTNKGRRYSGSSKMNFNSLLLHGLGAISVFIDVIATRLLIISALFIVLSLLAIITVILIRLLTDLAIPGWASTLLSSMLIVLLQSCLLSLFTIFLYLSFQSQRKFIPANHYKDYTGQFEIISHVS